MIGAYTVGQRPTEANFLWTVAIVNIVPYERIGPEAEPHELAIALIGGGDDDKHCTGVYVVGQGWTARCR